MGTHKRVFLCVDYSHWRRRVYLYFGRDCVEILRTGSAISGGCTGFRYLFCVFVWETGCAFVVNGAVKNIQTNARAFYILIRLREKCGSEWLLGLDKNRATHFLSRPMSRLDHPFEGF